MGCGGGGRGCKRKCLVINIPVNIGGKGVYAAGAGRCHCCFPLDTHKVGVWGGVWEGEVSPRVPSTLDDLTVSMMTWELLLAGVYTHGHCHS